MGKYVDKACSLRGFKRVAMVKREKFLGVTDELQKIIDWNMDEVKARRRDREAFKDIHLLVDHILFKIPCAGLKIEEFVSTREDECLVLASDGLWDVISNEEACEVARRRILLFHKKNGATTTPEKGQGVDPAAQTAAEYLSITLQKGSMDNISVIVVDLKAQRKFKS